MTCSNAGISVVWYGVDRDVNIKEPPTPDMYGWLKKKELSAYSMQIARVWKDAATEEEVGQDGDRHALTNMIKIVVELRQWGWNEKKKLKQEDANARFKMIVVNV